MQLNRHYWKAHLKKWQWVPEENKIKESYIEVEKNFTKNELNKYLRKDKLCVLGYFFLGLIVGCFGFLGNWISGLISMAGASALFLLCALLQYYSHHYGHNEYSYDLGQQDVMYESRLLLVFAEEIAQLNEEMLKQEELARKWRKKHPLEEKVRLALTKNPNYIADLLRYCELVKAHSDLKEHISSSVNKNDANNNGITVKYINNNSNRGRKKKSSSQ